MHSAALHCLLVSIAILLVKAEIKWKEENSWGFQCYLGEDFDLICNGTDAMVYATDSLVWKTPNGIEITGYSRRNDMKYQVTDRFGVTGMVLKVKKVTDEDHGVYICSIHRGGNFYARINRGLNLYQPLYRDMFDKYRDPTMIGGICAAVIFVPFVVACFVYRFRFKTEDQKREKLEAVEHAQKIRKGLNDVEMGVRTPEKIAPEIGPDGYANPSFQEESTNF